MKVIKRKATGALARMIADADKTRMNMTRNKMLVAAKIRDGIKSKNIRYKDFAEQMCISEDELSMWLSGDRNFDIDTLSKIEKVLEIKLIDNQINN